MEHLYHTYTPDTQIEHQWERPGLQHLMPEEPIWDRLVDEGGPLDEHGMPPLVPYVGRDLLKDKVALITGGDSGIGGSAAYLMACEGADIAINYLTVEQVDADRIRDRITALGRRCLLVPGNIGYEDVARRVVDRVIKEFGRIDCLVNNAGEQHMQPNHEEITGDQITRTFRSNIFSALLLTKHALPHMRRGSTIVNTASVVGYRGSPELVDYGCTKAAMVGFTRCLAKQLISRGIRVNCIAPGPVASPLQPISRDRESMDQFANHTDAPQGRIGQPSEVATSIIFLSSIWSTAFNGQTLHPNQWEIYNA